MISLRTLLEQQSQYHLYVDMDGVLTDFDKGYEQLTGLHTKHADVQDRVSFWEKLRTSLEEKGMSEQEFWATLPPSEGAFELWDAVKQYNPTILTSPSRNPESRVGKKEWVINNLSTNPPISFRFSGNKHEEMSGDDEEKRKRSILIDDYWKNLVGWKKNNGIGITHRASSYQDTLDQLKKLGL